MGSPRVGSNPTGVVLWRLEQPGGMSNMRSLYEIQPKQQMVLMEALSAGYFLKHSADFIGTIQP